MNRKNFLTLLAGVGAVALLAGAAIATQAQTPPPEDGHDHRGPPGHPPGPGMMMIPGLFPPGALPHVAKKLGLSADQETQIKGILDQAKPAFEKLHGQVHASMVLLAKTRPDDASYASVVANASHAMSDLAGQMVTQGSQVRAQVFGVLNADQKTKLVELEAHMHDGHGPGGPGHHHPDGPPPPDGAPPPPPR
jgi:Spy/CpxP family protein refolding chaperone